MPERDSGGLVDSLLARVGVAASDLPGRARALVNLAFVSIVLAIVWGLIASVADQPREWLLPAGALAVLGIVLIGVAAVVAIRGEPAGPDAGPGTEVPGGRFVIGCWLGRRTVASGAIRIEGAPAGLPSSQAVSVFVEPEPERLGPEQQGSDSMFDAVVSKIAATIRSALAKEGFEGFAAIGVGTPGIVDLASGSLSLSVTFPVGTNITHELARRLFAREPDLIRRAFPGVEHEDALRSRIYVDNDVRCIARNDLSQSSWREFTSIYVASGVGAGIVVAGEVHYGAHGSAGHIGHVELEGTGNGLRLTTGHVLGPAHCDCGYDGFHFEPFANYAGLLRIATTVAGEDSATTLGVIRQHFDQQGVRRDDFCRDGLAKVIAEADKELDHISVEMRPLFDRHPQVVKFCDEVLDAYVAVLAGGIGTLTNIVDTGRLFMSGPLIETLARNRCFRSYLQRHLPHHLLDRKAQPDLQRTDATQGLWRGAALLAWDPAFHRRRMRV